nr:PREDICTED: uncharacterized protein LOC104152157 isoform X2 [Struthio camelus australis]
MWFAGGAFAGGEKPGTAQRLARSLPPLALAADASSDESGWRERDNTLGLSMAFVLSCAVLVLLLPLAFPQEALRCRESKVILVTKGEPISIVCPFHERCSTDNTFYEIIWSYEKDLRRILQFRTTPPNKTSVMLRKEGHFGGQQLSSASEGLHCSAPPGSEVTLECDFSANVTGNFTELFWLHEREESPPRLIAWHHKSSCPDRNSTESRFRSSLDLENHQSRLTISRLHTSDSSWYQCESLGEFSGKQRGRGTNLTVKGSLTCCSWLWGVLGLLWLPPACTFCLLAFSGRSPSAGGQGQR